MGSVPGMLLMSEAIEKVQCSNGHLPMCFLAGRQLADPQGTTRPFAEQGPRMLSRERSARTASPHVQLPRALTA